MLQKGFAANPQPKVGGFTTVGVKKPELVYNTDMGNIQTSDVEKLARLSKLTLSDDDMKHIPDQLSESLGYVENLKDIDTSSVPENFFTTTAINVMDEDVVDESVMIPHEQALKNATATKNGYFVIKRIL